MPPAATPRCGRVACASTSAGSPGLRSATTPPSCRAACPSTNPRSLDDDTHQEALMTRKRRELDGRTAFVSGAASGIGRALAQRLAGLGCPVAIADEDEAGLNETAELMGGVGGYGFARRLDVRDRQAQMAFAAEVA